MRFKIYYDKTVKMSKEKLAAQVGHVLLNLGYNTGYNHGNFELVKINPREQVVIVLGLSHTKFQEQLEAVQESHVGRHHVQVDAGYTEVEAGTITAFGFIE